jgi:hypothetical protein
MKTHAIAAALALRAGDPVETALRAALISAIFVKHWGEMRSACGSWLDVLACRRPMRRGITRPLDKATISATRHMKLGADNPA